MATVFDTAKYILEKADSMSTWKLQKLVYYCQAWSLVWDEEPLFCEEIQAWANGPVCPALYKFHKGAYMISTLPIGSSQNLSRDQIDTVDAVLKFYGSEPGHYLRALTHKERPWRDARGTTPDGEPSNAVITHESMADYYGSL